MKYTKAAQKYKEMFNECMLLSEKYGLSTNSIKDNMQQIDNFKVTTPVVGGFSTGKSSMLNALLGEDILSVDITPETAIPTEIIYGPNRVQLCKNDNAKQISIEELKNEKFNINETQLIKLEYKNDFLKVIENVKIVDMPGFDSGIEIHNKSINDYLPNSLAYILVFSADDAAIKESIANFLNELKIYEVPVYVVITKCDKVTKVTLKEVKKYFEENIPKLLNIKDVKIACVEAQDNSNVPELKEIFYEIQNNSDDIFKKEFSEKLKVNAKLLENYLVSRINSSKLSVSEIDEIIKDLEAKISSTIKNLENEKNSFDTQAQKCIDKIKENIEADLNAASHSLEGMLLNGCDIKNKVNLIVRSTVMNGIKSELEPRLQKYLKNVSELIDINILNDTNIKIDGVQIAKDNAAKGLIIKSLPIIFTTVGDILGPISAILCGVIGIFVENIFKDKHENERRELARQKVENEIIPEVVKQASASVETEIKDYISQVNEEIFTDIEEQKHVMQKSLEDNKQKKSLEEQKKQKELNEINTDLLKVRSMVNEL